jgi:hypothetical protein
VVATRCSKRVEAPLAPSALPHPDFQPRKSTENQLNPWPRGLRYMAARVASSDEVLHPWLPTRLKNQQIGLCSLKPISAPRRRRKLPS